MGLFNKNKLNIQALLQEPVEEFKTKFKDIAHQLSDNSKNPYKINMDKVLEEFELLWGVSIPQELKNLENILNDLGFPLLRYWETNYIQTDILHSTENIVEKVLLQAQIEFPTDYHIDWFSGSISLDTIVNSSSRWSDTNFSFQYPIYEATILQKESPQIYLYNHNQPDMWGNGFEIFSKDLSSFLYIITMQHLRHHKKISDKNYLTCFEKIKNNVTLPYSFINYTRINNRYLSSYDFRYRPDTARGSNLTLDYFQRCRWIIELLKGNHDNYFWSIQNNMYKKYLNPELDTERHRNNLEHLPTHVPDALYYLFRCFFKGENNELKEYIQACKDSPSRIIRDAALLVNDFSKGKEFFGEIDNIQHVKRDFNQNMKW